MYMTHARVLRSQVASLVRDLGLILAKGCKEEALQHVPCCFPAR